MKNLKNSIAGYFHHHNKEFFIAIIVSVAASLMIYGLLLQRVLKSAVLLEDPYVVPKQEVKPDVVASPLTGVFVKPKLAKKPVTAIMIENSPEARPHSGLRNAGIVFEAVAEGGITRFVALYQENRPSLVGPVRSLRPYYLDWLMGFDAAIAHVGGSAPALQLVKQRGAKDLEQFRYGSSYWRATDRFAPHNVYTSFKKLDALQNSLGFKTSEFESYARTENEEDLLEAIKEGTADPPKVTNITADFSGALYKVQFKYNQKNNNYLRFLAGTAHKDRETGKQITAKNVVIIRMPTSIASTGHAVMKTLGNGDCVVFRDGVAIKCKWKKTKPTSQLQLLDADGQPVPLNRGSTWFLVVPTNRPVSY
jgi:hypothetical protein